MKINKISSFRRLFIMASIYICLSFWAAKTFSFEEFLQGVDFEKLTKDIEKSLEKSEQQKEAPLPPMPSDQTDQKQETSAPEQEEQNESSKIEDIETVFTEPITPVIEKGRPAPIKVSSNKAKAYDHFVGKMVNQLSELELIIENSPKISEIFRLFFTEFQSAIDEFIVQNDNIKSKKGIYLAKLYEDKEGANELRKKIVVASKKLDKFCQKLKLSEETELKNEENDEQELNELAQKKLDPPSNQKIIERKARGSRGAKESSSDSENKVAEAKIDEIKNIEKTKEIETPLPVSTPNTKETP